MTTNSFHIKPAEQFSKNELIKRLSKMKIPFDPIIPVKNYYIDKYNLAIKDLENQKLLSDELINDTNENDCIKRKRMLRENRMKNNIELFENEETKTESSKSKIIVFSLRKQRKEPSEKKEEPKNEEEKNQNSVKVKSSFNPLREVFIQEYNDNEKKNKQRLTIRTPSDVKAFDFQMNINTLKSDKIYNESNGQSTQNEIFNKKVYKFSDIVNETNDIESPLFHIEKNEIFAKNERKSEIQFSHIEISDRAIEKIKEIDSKCFSILFEGIALGTFGIGCYCVIKNSKDISSFAFGKNGILTSFFDKYFNISTILKHIFNCITNTSLSITEVLCTTKGKIYAVIILLIVIVLFLVYKKNKEREIIRKIYTAIKNELQIKERDEEGFLVDKEIAERDIIEKYAKESGYSERKFIDKVLPQLRRLRRVNSDIRECEMFSNGKNVKVWKLKYKV